MKRQKGKKAKRKKGRMTELKDFVYIMSKILLVLYSIFYLILTIAKVKNWLWKTPFMKEKRKRWEYMSSIKKCRQLPKLPPELINEINRNNSKWKPNMKCHWYRMLNEHEFVPAPKRHRKYFDWECKHCHELFIAPIFIPFFGGRFYSVILSTASMFDCMVHIDEESDLGKRVTNLLKEKEESTAWFI